MKRGAGRLTFRTTQVITGHGCFGEYLHRFLAKENAQCHHCNAKKNSVQHTLEVCPVFEAQRRALRASIGPNLSPAVVVKALAASKEKWKTVTLFCKKVMTTKEDAERARERSNAARTGRRRDSPVVVSEHIVLRSHVLRGNAVYSKIRRTPNKEDIARYLSGSFKGELALPSSSRASFWSRVRSAALKSANRFGFRWRWDSARGELSLECQARDGRRLTILPAAKPQVIGRLRFAISPTTCVTVP
ncbi:unnamed protein product [Heterotrigona itama]|uniref:Reverse transcriptase zinc-binding domain-containing protein n=1 Tax=Heterotrigona itama TaxID=395501 RepID=A0A6V7H126_9HYME|nr:unnamed protein product [Heterotrigona itama]